MNDLPHQALLPAGFPDILPPEAGHEADIVERLMGALAAHGYQRVKPPLVEFEETLLAGPGAAMAKRTFRVMDPVSQRMMGVRADLTLQIARIAESRLTSAPKPLRVCYAGDVLQVTGDQLRPERQFTQVGAELIDGPAPAADVEVIVMAVEALAEIGAGPLSIDLKQPQLVSALLSDLPEPEGGISALRHALDRKDVEAVKAASGAAGSALTALMAASGPADSAVAALRTLELPRAAAAERDRLLEVVEPVVAAMPDVTVTVDPVEHRGFEYHNGVSFTLFARGVRGELGRGGRYGTGGRTNGAADGDGGAPATGVTLFMDTVMRSLPPAETPRRLYIPHGANSKLSCGLRDQGWITVAGLGAVDDPVAEAQRLQCGHVLIDGKPQPSG